MELKQSKAKQSKESRAETSGQVRNRKGAFKKVRRKAGEGQGGAGCCVAPPTCGLSRHFQPLAEHCWDATEGSQARRPRWRCNG